MNRAPLFLLYLNVLVIATCGLIYELLAGTLASYLLGDSVTQFSLVIGIYLSAMGVGAWLSRWIDEGVARGFIEVELAVALLGGVSAPLLFLAFGAINWFRPLLFGLVFVIGVLVGLELPLLMRILKDHLDFRDLVARVLTFDYVGALLASLAFPILLVPQLGLVRTSLVFGICNALVGLWGTYLLRPLLSSRGLGALRGRAVLVVGLLVAGLIKADALTLLAEESVLEGTVLHSHTSPYQRIVVTGDELGFQLYLNGNLQFTSSDEYRYHEALVHPALAQVRSRRHVLVLGGGDGLAAREILKYPSVETVTLVDLDPAMTRLGQQFSPLKKLNRGALRDARVSIVNEDAFMWIGQAGRTFDAVIVDFPDPATYSISKLYTRRFFRLLHRRLSPHATVGIQCTSPLVAPKTFWCIIRTLEDAGFHVRPYRATVPTFGVWGFALAATVPLSDAAQLPAEVVDQLKFLNAATMANMFELPSDLAPVPSRINRLNEQILVRYYEEEWSRFN